MDLWNEEMYERLASVLEPVHDELVERLAPQPGERCARPRLGHRSDRAARRPRRRRGGRRSTAPRRSSTRLARTPRRRGSPCGSTTGNVEYLPYEDGEFDVIASAFGFIFAADHANVAGELARVARPGARLGFTAWKPNPKLGELYRRFTEEPLEGREATEWGREDHVEDMLGEDFELEFVDGTLWMDADSGEELWEVFSTSSPPVLRAPEQARLRARRGVPSGVRRALRDLPRRRPHPGAPPLPAHARHPQVARLRSRSCSSCTNRTARSQALEEYLQGFWGRDELVADLYLGYGLSASIRREATPAPPEPCALPLLACRVRPARGRERVSTVGFEVGEWERSWDDDGYAAAIETVALGDRARGRLPDEPRAAPVCAVRRRSRTRSPSRFATSTRWLRDRSPATAGRSCRPRPSCFSPAAATGS